MSSKDNLTPEKSSDKSNKTMSDKNLDRLIQQEALSQMKYNSNPVNLGVNRNTDFKK